MIYIVLNLVPILLATLAGLAFGILWYRIVDRRISMPRWRLLPVAFVAEFWLAAILAGALILAPRQAAPWTMALASAVVIWIGFVVPTMLVTHLHRRLPLRIALVDCGHWLGAMLVQAATLQVIGLQAPPA